MVSKLEMHPTSACEVHSNWTFLLLDELPVGYRSSRRNPTLALYYAQTCYPIRPFGGFSPIDPDRLFCHSCHSAMILHRCWTYLFENLCSLCYLQDVFRGRVKVLEHTSKNLVLLFGTGDDFLFALSFVSSFKLPLLGICVLRGIWQT